MLCMVPITNAALGTLPPQRLKNASGLFKLTRNLGGAVALALINTAMNGRMDLHLERLRESVTWGREVAAERLANMTQTLSSLGSDAHDAALSKLAGFVRQQAAVMAISGVFLLLTVLFVAIALLTPVMRKPQPRPVNNGSRNGRAAAVAAAGH
jgi:DHA2 family multidrug resistance protein